MNINQLKAEHPALLQQAVEMGVTQERERVSAHVTMGEASGDMKFAIGCIADGSELSASVNAKYLAAGMNRKDVQNRVDETVPPVTTPESAEAEHEIALAKATAEALGVEYNG